MRTPQTRTWSERATFAATTNESNSSSWSFDAAAAAASVRPHPPTRRLPPIAHAVSFATLPLPPLPPPPPSPPPSLSSSSYFGSHVHAAPHPDSVASAYRLHTSLPAPLAPFIRHGPVVREQSQSPLPSSRMSSYFSPSTSTTRLTLDGHAPSRDGRERLSVAASTSASYSHEHGERWAWNNASAGSRARSPPLASTSSRRPPEEADEGPEDEDGDGVTAAESGKKPRKRRRRSWEQPRDQERRKYSCAECGKAFARPSALTIHERNHTRARPFACPETHCQRGFTVLGNLRRHQKVYGHGQPPDAS